MLEETNTRLSLNVKLLQVTPNYNRTASEFLACLAPVCTSTGTTGGEDRTLPAQGPQSREEEPESSACTRDTETIFPGHQCFSLRDEVSTCWCISGVTSESQRGFTQSLPLSKEN